MELYIDGTDFNKITFAIFNGGKIIKKSFKIDSHQSHKTLQALEEFLKKSKIRIADINKIVVNKGPGSFTGTRVGVTHALALGLVLKAKVVPLAKEKFDEIFKKAAK